MSVGYRREFHPARLDMRSLDRVGYETGQTIGFLVDDCQKLSLVSSGGVDGLRKQCCRSCLDGCQRSLELVCKSIQNARFQFFTFSCRA